MILKKSKESFLDNSLQMSIIGLICFFSAGGLPGFRLLKISLGTNGIIPIS